ATPWPPAAGASCCHDGAAMTGRLDRPQTGPVCPAAWVWVRPQGGQSAGPSPSADGRGRGFVSTFSRRINTPKSRVVSRRSRLLNPVFRRWTSPGDLLDEQTCDDRLPSGLCPRALPARRQSGDWEWLGWVSC